VDPASQGIEYEGPSPTQGEGNSSVFWGDNQGPVVMVWNGMFPGEQESAKKMISDEDDWIIWRVKPPEVTRECGRGMTGIPRRSPTFLSGTGQD
jgi:hypothetical protein